MRHTRDVGELRHLCGCGVRVHVGGDIKAAHDLAEVLQFVDREAKLCAQRLDIEDLRRRNSVCLRELDCGFLQALVVLLGSIDGLANVGERRVDVHRRFDRQSASRDDASRDRARVCAAEFCDLPRCGLVRVAELLDGSTSFSHLRFGRCNFSIRLFLQRRKMLELRLRLDDFQLQLVPLRGAHVLLADFRFGLLEQLEP